MRVIWLVVAGVLSSGVADAGDAGLERMLRRLDLETRFEQLCAIEAMRRIDRADNAFHPDRADVSAISEPVAEGQSMKGSGGAFRSGGNWYRFSFICRASPDRMKVLDFKYTIGAKIPETDWETYGLWR
jgi:hypothetical protein